MALYRADRTPSIPPSRASTDLSETLVDKRDVSQSLLVQTLFNTMLCGSTPSWDYSDWKSSLRYHDTVVGEKVSRTVIDILPSRCGLTGTPGLRIRTRCGQTLGHDPCAEHHQLSDEGDSLREREGPIDGIGDQGDSDERECGPDPA